MVGRLVSKTIASGHRCIGWIRMIDLSTSARSGSADDFGMYQSARNNKASSRLPTNPKYRPRGIHHHCKIYDPEPSPEGNGNKRQAFRATEDCCSPRAASERRCLTSGKKWQWKGTSARSFVFYGGRR